jgi:OOP family OmpA-OmpF porin
MKVARASTMLGLVATTIIASPFAMAQDPGWYGGGNIGRSRSEFNEAQTASGQLGGGFTTTTITKDIHDTGFKVFGGYQFNNYFALESGYFDLGKFSFNATTLPVGALNGTTKVKGLNFDVVGLLPFTEKFSGLGRVGVTQTQSSASFSGGGAAAAINSSPRKYDTDYKYGAGVQYSFTKMVGLRAEMERYRVNDTVGHKAMIDLVSVGVVVRFAKKAPATVPVAAMPPSPESAVVETPVLVVVPVPAKTQQYCTILDIQFEIDQDDMQREEKEKLGVVGTFMTKYPDTTGVIEGHSDNVGSPEHNLELSQRRAESVVGYMVDTLHIDPTRLKAIGYGDTRPLADNNTEEGKRKNRRIDAVIGCVTDVEGLPVVPARITMAMMIEFDRNKADIKPEYHEELNKVANFLKANPSATATVEGHTGNLQATPQLAMEISRHRAQNVVTYLVDNFGMAPARLSTEGFGRARRFAYNTSVEGQQENRRVNIIINYPK